MPVPLLTSSTRSMRPRPKSYRTQSGARRAVRCARHAGVVGIGRRLTDLARGSLMPALLRKASHDDVPSMHRIRLSVTENRLSDPSRLGLADYEPYVSGVGETWVAETKQGIAGFASIDWSNASIWALFMCPEHEGQGFGKMLLGRLLERAEQLGLPSISLVTTPGTRAEAFYKKGGWMTIGIEPNGEVRMQYTLASKVH